MEKRHLAFLKWWFCQSHLVTFFFQLNVNALTQNTVPYSTSAGNVHYKGQEETVLEWRVPAHFLHEVTLVCRERSGVHAIISLTLAYVWNKNETHCCGSVVDNGRAGSLRSGCIVLWSVGLEPGGPRPKPEASAFLQKQNKICRSEARSSTLRESHQRHQREQLKELGSLPTSVPSLPFTNSNPVQHFTFAKEAQMVNNVVFIILAVSNFLSRYSILVWVSATCQMYSFPFNIKLSEEFYLVSENHLY